MKRNRGYVEVLLVTLDWATKKDKADWLAWWSGLPAMV